MKVLSAATDGDCWAAAGDPTAATPLSTKPATAAGKKILTAML
jgi:hypothetical protein